MRKKKRRKELSVPANRPADEGVDGELDLLGEGGADGHVEPGRSVVFATLEVCLCVLVRHYPDLSPRAASINSVMAMQGHKRSSVTHTLSLSLSPTVSTEFAGQWSSSTAI